MRFKFLIFLLLSVAVHFLILANLNLDKVEKAVKERPIDVSVIKKEKPKQETVPPKQQPPQKNYTKENSIDNGAEATLDDVPVRDNALKGSKDLFAKDDEAGAEPSQKKQSSEDAGRADEVPLIELPEMTAHEELSKEELNSLLKPKDIIDKYAAGGGDFEGSDFVSMQYVKLKYQSYFYKFANRLYRVWTYPRESVVRGEEGTVRISFVISKDGMVSSINVLESSGYPDLDREAIEALKKSAGVPLPKSYEKNFLKVDAYFKYILNKGFMVY